MRQAVPLGAVEVQAGLSDGPDPRMGGQLFNFRERLLQLAAGGVAGGIIGVQRNSPQQPPVKVHRLDREPR